MVQFQTNLNTMEQQDEIIELVESSKNILLTSHLSPDYDAIGSLVAVYWIIKSLGKDKVTMSLEDQAPLDFASFIEGIDRIKQIPLTEILSDFDLVIMLDANRKSRVSQNDFEFSNSQKVIIIDHHVSESDIEASINVQSPVTSTSELIFDVFDEKIKFSPQIARALLMGIFDDSGGFTYKGVTKHTYEVAAKLNEYGADTNSVVKQIKSYKSNVFEALKIAINNINFDKKYKYSFTYIPRDDYEILKLNGALFNQVMLHLIDILINMENHTWGFLVRPNNAHSCKVSFRSKTARQNVRELAELFGGGGHNQAAGATLEDISDPFEAVAAVRKKIEEHLRKRK